MRSPPRERLREIAQTVSNRGAGVDATQQTKGFPTLPAAKKTL